MTNKILTNEEISELKEMIEFQLEDAIETKITHADGAEEFLDYNYLRLLLDVFDNKVSIHEFSKEQIEKIICQIEFLVEGYEASGFTLEDYYSKTIQWLKEQSSLK